MATKEKDEAMYPIINDVRTLQALRHSITHQGEKTTVVYSTPSERSEQTKNSTTEAAYTGQTSPTNTQIIPQRPQDLLDNISLDLAGTNVKSSAQYRKSYAFKIWRDRGSFPYRLTEQPVVKEVVQRKKSKKYLNAVRAQKDREKEEAWKVFKSYRNTNNEMKYRRTSKFPRIRVEGSVTKHHDKEQLDTILSDSLQGNDPKSTHTKHQNSIPDYFKNKKESAQKSKPLASPTKSIPTSVIHTTKEVSRQTTQAEIQSRMTSDKGVCNVGEPLAQAAVLLEPSLTSKGNLLQDDKDNGIFQWSDTQTSSVGSCNIHVQGQGQLHTNAVNGKQKISTETMTRGSADSSVRWDGRSLPDNQSKEEADRSSKPDTSQSLSITANMVADNSVTRRDDIELLSTEHNVNVIRNQSPSPTPTQERNSEIDNSNLALIIKNSLAKKYSKENVKPNLGYAAAERGRKRVRNESLSSEEAERQRARIKQQKATMFTRLDEAVATNLAEGIHNVNSEYFPIEALANKAARETSKDVSDSVESKWPKTSIKYKVDEIERAR